MTYEELQEQSEAKQDYITLNSDTESTTTIIELSGKETLNEVVFKIVSNLSTFGYTHGSISDFLEKHNIDGEWDICN